MAEYGREQRNQLSRTITNSKTGSGRQQKMLIDNRIYKNTQSKVSSSVLQFVPNLLNLVYSLSCQHFGEFSNINRRENTSTVVVSGNEPKVSNWGATKRYIKDHRNDFSRVAGTNKYFFYIENYRHRSKSDSRWYIIVLINPSATPTTPPTTDVTVTHSGFLSPNGEDARGSSVGSSGGYNYLIGNVTPF